MKQTAFLLTFEDPEDDEVIQQLIDNIQSAFADEDLTPDITCKDYDDEHGGPVIYFP